MQQPGWLDYAWPEMGTREVSGAGSNARIAGFFKDAGHPEIASDDVAWCAAFVGACLVRAGSRGTGSLLARSYLAWGQPLDAFRLGAIAVLSRGSDPNAGHVGFLVGETRDGIRLLGGNQNNAVTIEEFPKSRLLGLRWSDKTPDAGNRLPDETIAGGDFDWSLVHVLEMEGGWSEDPYDPGGPTNQGITLGVYAAWKGATLDATNTAALKEDLRRISPDTVRTIYRQRYWEPSGAGALSKGLALMHFDAAVNHGVGAASRMLQEAAGATIDGDLGPETRAAIARHTVRQLVSRYAEIRRARYRALPHFWRFGKGWLRRADVTQERALAAAQHTSVVQQQKGSDAMQTETTATPKWWGQSMTIWGAIITALATVAPAVGPVVGIDITGEVIRQAGGQAAQAFQAVAGLVGTVLTIWGRIRAVQPLQQRDVTFRF